jgi:pilus assembly protein Flp/PilA
MNVPLTNDNQVTQDSKKHKTTTGARPRRTAYRFKLERAARPGRSLTGRLSMNNALLNLYVKFQGLKNEDGQDLVEYALLVALIALVCVTGVSNVASAVNTVFSNISSSLA